MTWAPGSHPAEETFSFDFGTPVDAAEVAQHDGACVARTWVQVQVTVTVTVTVTSASGHVAAEGLVAVYGVADGEPTAFLAWPDDGRDLQATLTGPYRTAAEAAEDGLTDAFLGLGVHGWTDGDTAPTQGVGISATYVHDQGASSVSLYSCAPGDDGVENACISLGD